MFPVARGLTVVHYSECVDHLTFIVVWFLHIIRYIPLLVLWMLCTIDKGLHDHVPFDCVLTAVHYLEMVA